MDIWILSGITTFLFVYSTISCGIPNNVLWNPRVPQNPDWEKNDIVYSFHIKSYTLKISGEVQLFLKKLQPWMVSIFLSDYTPEHFIKIFEFV